MIRIALNYLSDYAGNLTTSAKLNYISESKDWAIKQVGRDLINRNNHRIKGRITTSSRGLRNKIIHFGSVNTFSTPHESNRCVMSWYHITRNDENLKNIKEIGKHLEILHTTNKITRRAFLDMGMNEDQIVTIPLGVDLNLFHPTSEVEGYWELRNKLGMPSDAKIIGSFQKDGNGWGEGLEPKWVKNPQMFVEVIKKLNRESGKRIFVLLLGVARGFIKNQLLQNKIPFKHIYLKDIKDVAQYYRVLDMYICSSRNEGMPNCVLESMASGIPIIITKVGIAPEIIKNGENGFLVDINDTTGMTNYALDILNSDSLAHRLKMNGLDTARKFSGDIIADRFYNEIYKRLEE